MWDTTVDCPMKASSSYVIICEPCQKFELSKGDFIMLCNSTLKPDGSICNYVPPFALVKRRQMRKVRKENQFCWTTSSFQFDPSTDRQCVLLNFWETELLLQSLELRSHSPATDVSKSLVSFWNNPKRCFLHWKLFLLNSLETSKKLAIMKSDFSNVADKTLHQ